MAETLPALTPRLEVIIEAIRPATIVRIGDVLAPGPKWHDRETVIPGNEATTTLGPSVRFDLALVDAAASIPPQDVPVVLARLRDLSARHVLIATFANAEGPWSRRELVGFGFVHLGDCTLNNAAVNLFEFDISTYKTTPDWLNPRNWANPELWERYRW